MGWFESFTNEYHKIAFNSWREGSSFNLFKKSSDEYKMLYIRRGLTAEVFIGTPHNLEDVHGQGQAWRLITVEEVRVL